MVNSQPDVQTIDAATQRHARPFSLSAYGEYAVVLLVVSTATLIPSFLGPLAFSTGNIPPSIVLHGFAFLAWYVLVVVQSGLIGARRVSAHKTLGYLSVGFALFLAISGAQMLAGTMTSYDANWSAEHLASRTSFVWAILHALLFFSGSFILAVLACLISSDQSKLEDGG